MSEPRRTITLRSERSEKDWRNLWAFTDDEGNLHIDGQDLGPGTDPVSPDGEYEWFETIQAVDIPRLIELLGGEPGSDPLDILQERWSGSRSYELERLLENSEINLSRSVY